MPHCCTSSRSTRNLLLATTSTRLACRRRPPLPLCSCSTGSLEIEATSRRPGDLRGPHGRTPTPTKGTPLASAIPTPSSALSMPPLPRCNYSTGSHWFSTTSRCSSDPLALHGCTPIRSTCSLATSSTSSSPSILAGGGWEEKISHRAIYTIMTSLRSAEHCGLTKRCCQSHEFRLHEVVTIFPQHLIRCGVQFKTRRIKEQESLLNNI